MAWSSYYVQSLSPVSVDRVLICKQCHKHIASMDDFLSRDFHGAQSPKAGLFEDVSNVSLGERQVWLMRTGAHTVRETHCLGCGAYVGWKFVTAHEEQERWKEGAYVVERGAVLVHSVFEGDELDSDRRSDRDSMGSYAGSEQGSPGPAPQLKLKPIQDLGVRNQRRWKPLPLPPPSEA